MIRLRLCDREDYIGSSVKRAIARWYTRERDFLEILNGNVWEEEKFPPFRDAESAGLIREVNQSEFVEDDWYSMVTCFGRTCLSAACSGVKYGLTVIANSRDGFYTDLTGDAGAGGNVWEYLAGLEMDILVAYPYKEFLKDGVLPTYLPRPYIVENFRYRGEVLEAVVTTENIHSLPEYRNGKLHVEPWMCELTYDWTKDVDGVICWLEKNIRKEVILQQPEQILMLFEFWEMLCDEDVKSVFENYRVNAKIHNHMLVKPEKPMYRDVPMLLIEKTESGYHLETRRNSNCYAYEDMFYDAVNDVPEHVSLRFALVLDTYAMDSAESLQKAVCGVRVCGQRIDTYDKKDALSEFLRLLRNVKQTVDSQ